MKTPDPNPSTARNTRHAKMNHKVEGINLVNLVDIFMAFSKKFMSHHKIAIIIDFDRTNLVHLRKGGHWSRREVGGGGGEDLRGLVES